MGKSKVINRKKPLDIKDRPSVFDNQVIVEPLPKGEYIISTESTDTYVDITSKPRRNIVKVDLAEVEYLAGLGLADKDIALCLGYSENTLRTNQGKYTALRIAAEKGRAKAIALVSNAIMENAIINKNIVAQIFWLKNRAGWVDKVENEVKGDVTINIQQFSGITEQPREVNNNCINGEYTDDSE